MNQHTIMPNTLREVRKQAGLTQLDIAKKLDFASTDRIDRKSVV